MKVFDDELKHFNPCVPYAIEAIDEFIGEPLPPIDSPEYLARLVPIERTCAATETAVVGAVKTLLPQHFRRPTQTPATYYDSHREPTKFYVHYEHHGKSEIDRKALVDAIAELLPSPDYVVDAEARLFFFVWFFFWFYFLVSRPLARSVVVSSTPRRSSRRRTLRLVRGTNDIRDRVPRRRARQRPPAVQRAETVQPPRARGRISSRGVWRRRGDGGGGDDERRRVPVIARRGGAGPRDGRDGSARTMKTEARPAREHEVRRKKTEDA